MHPMCWRGVVQAEKYFSRVAYQGCAGVAIEAQSKIMTGDPVILYSNRKMCAPFESLLCIIGIIVQNVHPFTLYQVRSKRDHHIVVTFTIKGFRQSWKRELIKTKNIK